MTGSNWDFRLPTAVHFGWDRLSTLPDMISNVDAAATDRDNDIGATLPAMGRSGIDRLNRRVFLDIGKDRQPGRADQLLQPGLADAVEKAASNHRKHMTATIGPICDSVKITMIAI